MRPGSLAFASSVLVALAGCSSSEAELERLLACHDAAVGGPALRAFTEVAYDLEITEPTFSVQGRYVANRAGTMRIDVFAGGTRVYSEWFDGTRAFEQARDASEGVEVGGDAAAALRHGIEQPGHLWTLADMRANGHRVEWAEPDTTDRSDERALKLTLRDGFEQWYWVDPVTCRIARKRNFRAFHPTVDPTRKWTETRYADFEAHDGVTRAMTTFDIDVATGDTIGRTRIRSVTARR